MMQDFRLVLPIIYLLKFETKLSNTYSTYQSLKLIYFIRQQKLLAYADITMEWRETQRWSYTLALNS